jgi:hypothetical protein
MSNRGRIAAYGRGVLLTVQTNAGWRQRIRIQGPGVSRTVEGSGERNIIWQHWTSAGAWEVEHWFLRPGGGWEPGTARRRGIGQIGFDDGGGDGDFQDALVTATVVTKATLEAVPEVLKRISEEKTDRAEYLVLPGDSGVTFSDE